MQINCPIFYPKKLNSLSSLEKLNNMYNLLIWKLFDFWLFYFYIARFLLYGVYVLCFLLLSCHWHFITFSIFPQSASAAPTHTCSLLLLVSAAATHLILLQFVCLATGVSFCSVAIIAAIPAFLFLHLVSLRNHT